MTKPEIVPDAPPGAPPESRPGPSPDAPPESRPGSSPGSRPGPLPDDPPGSRPGSLPDDPPGTLDNSRPSPRREELTVSPEESGMKLLRFLERRLHGAVAKSMLYKWIRTGQVRVNKGRSDPHRQLEQGDAIRVPPFAEPRQLSGVAPQASVPLQPGQAHQPGQLPKSGPQPKPGQASQPGQPVYPCPRPLPEAPDLDVPVIGRVQDVLVLCKPANLAVHPGTAIADSLTQRLAAAFAGQPFIPAPAHRLDRQTSGLILIGTSHNGQAKLHESFATGSIQKQYLAWVSGKWPHAGATLLVDDAVSFQGAGGRQSLQRLPYGRHFHLGLPDAAAATDATAATGSTAATDPANATGAANTTDATGTTNTPGAIQSPCPAGKADILSEFRAEVQQEKGPGLAVVFPVCFLPPRDMPAIAGASKGSTLLLVQLLTGKKHQIRIQTASRKHPVIGDNRYGGPRFPHMLLHSFSVRLPASLGSAAFSAAPVWPAPFQPDPDALAAAAKALSAACRSACPEAFPA